jgi:hypothetical protein
MPVIMTVMFFLGVQSVPPDAGSFTLRSDQALIRFTRQGAGGWRAVLDSGVDLGVWRVEGARVIVEVEDSREVLDLADITSCPANDDWTKPCEVNLGATRATLEIRKGDREVAIVVTHDATESLVTIEWPQPTS